MFHVSCAKKPVEVGRENPELEIQKCMKYSEKKQFEEAVECLEIFKSHFPKSQWGIEAEITTRTVDTHIKRLREKLGPAGDIIETIRGVGYKLLA